MPHQIEIWAHGVGVTGSESEENTGWILIDFGARGFPDCACRCG
jgi:hypothetical protein